MVKEFKEKSLHGICAFRAGIEGATSGHALLKSVPRDIPVA
jgi:hypothetical protein